MKRPLRQILKFKNLLQAIAELPDRPPKYTALSGILEDYNVSG